MRDEPYVRPILSLKLNLMEYRLVLRHFTPKQLVQYQNVACATTPDTITEYRLAIAFDIECRVSGLSPKLQKAQKRESWDAKFTIIVRESINYFLHNACCIRYHKNNIAHNYIGFILF